MTATGEANSPWKELRARERLVVFGSIGFFPVAGGLALFVSRFTSAERAVAAVPVGLDSFGCGEMDAVFVLALPEVWRTFSHKMVWLAYAWQEMCPLWASTL
jgi:hypothetical protein